MIYVGGGMSEKIEAAFDGHQVDVLFGAEVFCWPDDELSVSRMEILQFLNVAIFDFFSPSMLDIRNNSDTWSSKLAANFDWNK